MTECGATLHGILLALFPNEVKLSKLADFIVQSSNHARVVQLALATLIACSSLNGTGQESAGKLSPGEHYAVLEHVRLHYTVAGSGPLPDVEAGCCRSSALLLAPGFLMSSAFFYLR